MCQYLNDGVNNQIQQSEDIKQQLSIWQKYIDVLCKKAEDTDCFFISNKARIRNDFAISIIPSHLDCNISPNKLIGSEVTIMYNNYDITNYYNTAEDGDDLDEYNKYEFDANNDYANHIDEVKSGDIEFDYVDKIGFLDDLRNNKIVVKLYPQYEAKIRNGHFVLPSNFCGKINNIGDIVQYKRLKFGIKQLINQLQNSDIFRALLFCHNNDIVGNLKPIDTSSFVIDKYLSSELNFKQKQAVQMAISTDNSISLIQGPPGTGKTTVIAEICYQNAIRGRRTLIASQSNLAIDNAMSRLIYSKEILPIREGNVSRIDEIGEKYIPSNIVKTLLDGAVLSCHKKADNIKINELDIYKIQSITNEIISLYNNAFNYCSALIVDAYYYSINYLYDALNIQRLIDPDFSICTQTISMANSVFADINKQSRQLENTYTFATTKIDSLINELIHFAPDQCLDIESLANDITIEQNSLINTINNLSSEFKQLFLSKPSFIHFIKKRKWKQRISIFYNTLKKVKSFLTNNRYDLVQMGDCDSKRDYWKKKYYVSKMIYAINTLIQKSVYINLEANLESKNQSINSINNIVNILIGRKGEHIYPNAYCAINSVNDLLDVAYTIGQAHRKCSVIKNSCNFSITAEGRSASIYDFCSIISALKDRDIYDQNALVQHDDYYKYNHGIYKNSYSNTIKNEIISANSMLTTAIKSQYQLDSISEFECLANIKIKELQEYNNKQNKIKSLLNKWCDSIKSFNSKMASDLFDIIMKNVNVVSITCLQSASKTFKEKYKDITFDTVVIDEVSKSIPPELILPSTLGKSLVLIGDHKQLPPMIDNQTLDEINEDFKDSLKESVFKILFENIESTHKIMLNVQYRMHSQIMNVINCFYDNALLCGLSKDEEETKKNHCINGTFITMNNHVIWFDIPNKNRYFEGKDGTSTYNISEISAIKSILAEINDNLTIDKTNVSIISFYGAQIKRIKESINIKEFPKLNIKISTVDRFQGAESEIVIVSTVRNNSYGDIGFAKSFERINVAFSRAQKLLIIVGSSEMLTTCKNSASNAVYQKIYSTIQSYNGIVPVEVLKTYYEVHN